MVVRSQMRMNLSRRVQRRKSGLGVVEAAVSAVAMVVSVARGAMPKRTINRMTNKESLELTVDQGFKGND